MGRYNKQGQKSSGVGGGVGCNTDRDINHRMGGVTGKGTEIAGRGGGGGGGGGVGCNTDRDINHRMGGVTGTEITGY